MLMFVFSLTLRFDEGHWRGERRERPKWSYLGQLLFHPSERLQGANSETATWNLEKDRAECAGLTGIPGLQGIITPAAGRNARQDSILRGMVRQMPVMKWPRSVSNWQFSTAELGGRLTVAPASRQPLSSVVEGRIPQILQHTLALNTS